MDHILKAFGLKPTEPPLTTEASKTSQFWRGSETPRRELAGETSFARSVGRTLQFLACSRLASCWKAVAEAAEVRDLREFASRRSIPRVFPPRLVGCRTSVA